VVWSVLLYERRKRQGKRTTSHNGEEGHKSHNHTNTFDLQKLYYFKKNKSHLKEMFKEHLNLAQQHTENFLKSLVDIHGHAVPSEYSIHATWPWILFILLAVVQFAFNWLAKFIVAAPIAECLFGQLQNNARRKMYKKRRTSIEKFSQSMIEAFFYTSYFFMGLIIISKAPWVWPSKLWWVAQDVEGKLILPLNQAETTFYVAYAARYFAFFVCVFLEPKRKDFWEMVIHHVTTVVLIVISFLSGFVRVGFVVMVLLDFADTFLHVAKLFKYTHDNRVIAGLSDTNLTKISSTCADIWFALFAITFSVSRIGFFGYVTWSVWFEAMENFVSNEKYGLHVGMNFKEYFLHGLVGMNPAFICQLLITVLFILMCIWEYFLLVAVANILSGNELKDVRSDSEDTGDDKEM
jgi:hypothetical protein